MNEATLDLPSDWRIVSGFRDAANPLTDGMKVRLPVRPNEIFPDFKGSTAHYTLETTFALTPDEITRLPDPAFFFPMLGEGYNLYLNGNSIVENLRLHPDGELSAVTTGRGLIVPFPSHLLRAGENRLSIHLAGFTRRTALSSNSVDFGLPVKGGYRLASHTTLMRENSEMALYAFCGVYAVFAFYSLLYFVRRPKHIYTLYFALFTCTYSVYLVCLSNRTFASVADVRTVICIAYAAQPAALGFFVAFLNAYIGAGFRKTTRLMIASDSILAIAALLLPYPYLQSWLIVFYMVMAPQLILVLYIIGAVVKRRAPGSAFAAASISLGLGFVVWDILDTVFFRTSIRLSRYAHFPVILAMMLMLVNRSLASMEEVEKLNLKLSFATKDLDQRVQERTRQLEAAMSSAKRADRAKTSFLANMSHEIRTPLNVLIGMGDWLHEREEDSEKRRVLASMLTAGNGLLTLIQELLDVARIESGTIRLDSVPFDPEAIAEDVVHFFEGRANQKSLELHYESPGKKIGSLRGDPARIRQVLVNLLGNSLKFTEAGSVSLSLSLLSDASDTASIRFSVKDTGPGIAPEDTLTVFERFAQGVSSMNRKYAGTGLGLSISQDLLKLMGSKIDLTTEVGQGSEFAFTLALPKCADVVPETSHTPSLNDQRPLRILVAEDDEVNRTLLSMYFAQSAHTLEFAHNGLEAVRAFESHPFDVIFMDLMMPEMDGIEATIRIRKIETELLSSGVRTQKTPILALSASTYAEDVALSKQAGCDEHLAKPVKRATLFAALARVTS